MMPRPDRTISRLAFGALLRGRRPGPRTAPGARLKHFLRHRDGVAAVEFGFIAPIMLLLYVGLVTFLQGWAINTRLAGIASITGDLVAQTTGDQSSGTGGQSSVPITTADLDDIMKIVDSFIEPYDPTSVRVTITSMVMQNGVPVVDWSYAHNGAPKHPKGSKPFPTADMRKMLSTKTNLIVAEVRYTFSTRWYNAIVGGRFGANALALKETMFFLPRQADRIVLAQY